MLTSLNESSGDPIYDPVMAIVVSKKFSGLSAPLIGSMASIVIGSMACLLCSSMACLLCGCSVNRLASLAIGRLASLAIGRLASLAIIDQSLALSAWGHCFALPAISSNAWGCVSWVPCLARCGCGSSSLDAWCENMDSHLGLNLDLLIFSLSS